MILNRLLIPAIKFFQKKLLFQLVPGKEQDFLTKTNREKRESNL